MKKDHVTLSFPKTINIEDIPSLYTQLDEQQGKKITLNLENLSDFHVSFIGFLLETCKKRKKSCFDIKIIPSAKLASFLKNFDIYHFFNIDTLKDNIDKIA